MKVKSYLLILVFLIVLVSPSIVQASPAMVGTSTNRFATATTYQRKSFYANSRFWIVYFNGSHSVFSSSLDGASWSSPAFFSNNSADKFSLWNNATHIHYVRGTPAIKYRVGTLGSGTITWITTEQTVSSGDADFMTLCVDSSNYPIIGYLNGTDEKPYVIKSEWNNGSWSTATGYPYLLKDDVENWGVIALPLNNERFYMIYAKNNDKVWGRLFNGSAWETESEISISKASAGERISATVENDNIHLVFKSLDPTVEIKYLRRDNITGWSSETTIQSSVGLYSLPTISCEGEKLFVFWLDGEQIQSSYAYSTIYFKAYLFGSWTNRQVYVSPINGVVRGTLTSFFEKTSHKLGILYTSGIVSPYSVEFDQFTYTASATPFTINNTGFDCPIFDASYDVESGVLTFRSSGNVTISGATDNCLWIADDDDYLSSWSWNAGTGEISLINVDGVIRVYFSETLFPSGGTRDSTQESEGLTPFIPQIGSTGIYLIIGAVGVLTVAGIIKKGRTGKVQKRLSGNRSSRGIRRPHGARRK